MSTITFARKLQAAKQAKKGQEGFSIVEAAVAVAIAGILTAAALPSFKNALGSAKLVEPKNQVSALLTEAYADAVGGGTGAVTLPAAGKWTYTTATGGGATEVAADGADGAVKGCVNWSNGKRIINAAGPTGTATAPNCLV